MMTKNNTTHKHAIELIKMGRPDEAVQLLSKLCELYPDDPNLMNDLGMAFLSSNNNLEALDCFEKAVEIKYDHTEALGNIGDALIGMGMLDSAAEHFRETISLFPNNYYAHSKLGNILLLTGNVSEAEMYYKNAISIAPSFPDAYCNLASIYMLSGKTAESIELTKKSLELDPSLSASHSNLLLSMNYLECYTQDEIYAASCDWSKMFRLASGVITENPMLNNSVSERLRIGYISADFKNHSVSHFIKPVLKCHDTDMFEIFAYSNATCPDETTILLQGLTEHWTDCAPMSDEALTKKIANDGIDILVDLSGHTAGNRLRVFTAKPAKIQVTWLGYPNTTGLAEMDYRLCDDITDPEGCEDGYSETLIRIPEGFLCYSPPDNIPELSTPPCLRNGFITFCSFNNIAKLSNATIRCWSEILLATPDSKLLLKGLFLEDASLRDKLLGRFLIHGISSDRLELLGYVNSETEHLELYNRADIALDPFPYNGTTTTFEALLMGVPVITMTGKRHASRVGASILTRIGFGWCAEGKGVDDYIRTACKIAKDIERLNEVRVSLRQALLSSFWCDMAGFTCRLENIYRGMLAATIKIL